VLATPPTDPQKRDSVVSRLCKIFAENCQNQDITVDLVDLYKESDFNPILYPNEQETKILEYQIRIRRAQMIVFFHPIWLGGVPAILKGFLEKTFTSGFAFKTYKGIQEGLLSEKRALVVAVGHDPDWKYRFLQANSLQNFWERAVFQPCGMIGQFILFGGLRQASDQKLKNWEQKMKKISKNLNNPQKFSLELF
jgi:putative NADPH-quinone reductase